MKKSTTLADSYIRAADFASRLAGVQLPSEIWAVFARCDCPRTPPQIARLAKLDEATVVSALRSLVRRKLVQKHRARKDCMDWQDYLAANGVASAVEAQVETQPPDIAPRPPLAPTPASASADVLPPSTRLPPAAPAGVAPFQPPAPDAAPPVSPFAQPVAFSLVNAAAAISRRIEARQELRFRVEKTTARAIAA